MRKLYGTIRALKEWPGRGLPGREEGTREVFLPPTPYVAVYRVKEQTVEVMGIYHAAQDSLTQSQRFTCGQISLSGCFGPRQ